MDLSSQAAELYDVALSVLSRARAIKIDKVKSAQDAMLNMRIDWEELQARLRNRKLDGFEPAIEAMLQLAATTVAVTAELQALIRNQRIKQLRTEAEAVEPLVTAAAAKVAKARRKKKESRL